ncbi:MAG: transglutaminaseTgpA domain-containing protein [Chloroflexia bacterium]
MPKFLRLQEGWLTVGLLALLLFSVTLSVQHAQWSDGLSVLTPITLIGLLTGVILAKINRVPRFLLDLVGLQIGLITVLLATASIMRDPRFGTVQERVQDLLARTSTWIGVAIRQDVSDDLVVFILSLAIVAWVLAYSSAYFVFRSRQLWWALVPNGIALLINISYSSIDINGYIIVFMFSALLLMIRFNLLTKEERWQRERVNYSPGLTWAFLWTGSSVSVALALSMWFVPTTSVNTTLNGMWEQVNQPWVDFQTNMSRLWSQLPGNASVGGYSSFSDSFTMGGALNLSDSVALVVKSKEGLYLRTTTYDQYNGIGWENTAEDTFHVPDLSPRLHLDAGQPLNSLDLARTEVTYTVQIASPKKDILFTSLRPVSLDAPSRLEVSWRDIDEAYDVDALYSDGGSIDSLPLELRSVILLLREAQHELRDTFKTESVDSGYTLLNKISEGEKGRLISEQIAELSKRGVALEIIVENAPGFSIRVLAQGQVPVYDDISAIRAVNPVQKNDRYDAVSSISRATAAELQSASANYDGWLTRYMALPAGRSREIGELAATVVFEADASNPYDQARAIEAYLRDNYTYNTNIPTPPAGTDPVEWFLFQNKQGYCTYYAASMIVMLRSIGIPARLSTGYAPGNYDSTAQTYVVTEARAHAWPEVYFPGYGWINFEPTPSEAVVTRETAESSIIPEPTPNAAIEEKPNLREEEEARNLEEKRQQEEAAAAAAARVDTTGGAFGGGLLVLAVVSLAAALLFLPFSPLRRKSPTTAIAYYGRMLRWARLGRLGPAAHQTPFEFSEALSREVRGTSVFTRAIARAYVRERFGGRPLGPAEQATLNKSWDSLRKRLWRKVPVQHLGRVRRRRH